MVQATSNTTSSKKYYTTAKKITASGWHRKPGTFNLQTAAPTFTFKIRWIHNVLDVNSSCRLFQKTKTLILHQNVITCPTSETSFLTLDVTKPSYFSTCHIATTFQDPVKSQWVKSSALLFSTSLWNVTRNCKCHFKLTLKNTNYVVLYLQNQHAIKTCQIQKVRAFAHLGTLVSEMHT